MCGSTALRLFSRSMRLKRMCPRLSGGTRREAMPPVPILVRLAFEAVVQIRGRSPAAPTETQSEGRYVSTVYQASVSPNDPEFRRFGFAPPISYRTLA